MARPGRFDGHVNDGAPMPRPVLPVRAVEPERPQPPPPRRTRVRRKKQKGRIR